MLIVKLIYELSFLRKKLFRFLCPLKELFLKFHSKSEIFECILFFYQVVYLLICVFNGCECAIRTRFWRWKAFLPIIFMTSCYTYCHNHGYSYQKYLCSKISIFTQFLFYLFKRLIYLTSSNLTRNLIVISPKIQKGCHNHGKLKFLYF